MRGASSEYAAALQIDDHPALVHYARARCFDRLGRWDGGAGLEYRRASDLDEVPMG